MKWVIYLGQILRLLARANVQLEIIEFKIRRSYTMDVSLAVGFIINRNWIIFIFIINLVIIIDMIIIIKEIKSACFIDARQ